MGRESVEVDKLAVKGDAGMEKEWAEDDIERDMEKGEGLEKELSELEEENERLRRENELLKEYRASLPLKERLYDRVPLTVKQLDIIDRGSFGRVGFCGGFGAAGGILPGAGLRQL